MIERLKSLYPISCYIILFTGISLFFVGLHSVDLAQHFYRAGISDVNHEISLGGDVGSIDDVYTTGMQIIIFGFVLFGIGSMMFASLIDNLKK